MLEENKIKSGVKGLSTWFKEKFIEYNTIERCQKIARDFINLALDSIKNENNSKLEKTALSMIERNF